MKAATYHVQQVLPGRIDADLAASPPALAREQRMRSLGRANQTRTARAALKNELATGREQIEDVLKHPPPRVTRALARSQIPYAKTAAALSERQRAALIALLRPERAPKEP
ncbi:MAG TPA: hypothetical protein VK821_12080 [Dehalococcoidia bacterium]|nr:hypothetical protein [Dehalococcoidia bacterium]